MAKYSKGTAKKVEKVMKEKKAGTLKTGSGKKVTSKKQAIAIGLSEARKKGSKVPAPPQKLAAKKAAPKKAAVKKAAPKKSSMMKKSAPKKVSAKKSPVQKKTVSKKAAVKKSAPKKAIAKKSSPVKKSAPLKKVAASKKTSTKKAAPKKTAPKTSLLPARVRSSALMEEKNNLPMAANEAPVTTPDETIREIPVTENTEAPKPVEEPNETNPVTAEHHGAPMPPDKYGQAKDTYHGHMNPSSKKGSIKPSGKKPLWNK